MAAEKKYRGGGGNVWKPTVSEARKIFTDHIFQICDLSENCLKT